MRRFRGRYYYKGYVQVEFNATNQGDADDIMSNYPQHKDNIRFTEITSTEWMDDFEAKELPPLNDGIRELKIEVGGQSATVSELLNAVVGLDLDLAFGSEYLNRFDIRRKPRISKCPTV